MQYLSGLLGGEKRSSRGIWQTCGASGQGYDGTSPPKAMATAAAATGLDSQPQRVAHGHSGFPQQQQQQVQKARRGQRAYVSVVGAGISSSQQPMVPSYSYSQRYDCVEEASIQPMSLREGQCFGSIGSTACQRLICSVTGKDLLGTYPQQCSLAEKRDIGVLSLHYFDVGPFLGRGGKIQTYLAARQVKHNYNRHRVEKWRETKMYLINAGVAPLGTLPALSHDAFGACETKAIMRYLARCLDEFHDSPRIECGLDMSCERLTPWYDELQGAVWAWLVRGSDGLSTAASIDENFKWLQIECELIESIPKLVCWYMLQRETYYKQAEFMASNVPGPPTLTPGCNFFPSWVDCLAFATMHDDMTLLHALRNLLGEAGMQRLARALAQQRFSAEDPELWVTRQAEVMRSALFSPADVFERFPRLSAIYDRVFALPDVRMILEDLERARRAQQQEVRVPLTPPLPTHKVPGDMGGDSRVQNWGSASVAAGTVVSTTRMTLEDSEYEEDHGLHLIAQPLASECQSHCYPGSKSVSPSPGYSSGSYPPDPTPADDVRHRRMAIEPPNHPSQPQQPSTPDTGKRHHRLQYSAGAGVLDLPSRSPAIQAGAAMASRAVTPPTQFEETTTTSSLPSRKNEEYAQSEWVAATENRRSYC